CVRENLPAGPALPGVGRPPEGAGPLHESAAPGASDSGGCLQGRGPRAALVFQHQHTCGSRQGEKMERDLTLLILAMCERLCYIVARFAGPRGVLARRSLWRV